MVGIEAVRHAALVEVAGAEVEARVEVAAGHEVLEASAARIGSAALLDVRVAARAAVHALPARRNTLVHDDNLVLPVVLEDHVARGFLLAAVVVGKVELILLEEVPELRGRHDLQRVVRVPVVLARQGDERHLDALVLVQVAGAPGLRGRAVARIGLEHLRVVRVAALIFRPLLHIVVDAAVTARSVVGVALPFHHRVGSAVNVHDRHGARSHGVAVVDGNSAHRTEGGHQAAQLGHAVVSQHSAHREARHIDAVPVDVVLFLHFLHQHLDELRVRRARDVPHVVDALRIGHDDVGRIGQVVPFGLVHLVVRVLAGAVQRDDQGRFLFHLFRHIGQSLAGRGSHRDFLPGLCRHGLAQGYGGEGQSR